MANGNGSSLLADLMPKLVLHTGIGGDVVIPLDPLGGAQAGTITVAGIAMPYDVQIGPNWEPVVVIHAPTGDVLVQRQSGAMTGVLSIGGVSVPYDIMFGAVQPAPPTLFGMPLGTALLLGGMALVVLYWVRGR